MKLTRAILSASTIIALALAGCGPREELNVRIESPELPTIIGVETTVPTDAESTPESEDD